MGEKSSFRKVASTFLIAAAVVSQSAPIASADTSADDISNPEIKSPLPVVDGLRSDQVRDAIEYMTGRGLAESQFEDFANYLSVTLPELYHLASAESVQSARGEVVPPVELVDGKVRYNSAVVNDIEAIRSKTETQVGQHSKAQGCVFPAIDADDEFGQHVLSEVTELDPENCSRVIVSASYDPDTFNGPEPTVAARGDSFIPGLSCKDGKWPETAGPTLFSPNRDYLDGEHRRYYKQAFVDPICISITSSALNVSWKNQVNSTSGVTLIDRDKRTYYYTQLGENWVNKAATLTPSSQPIDRANSVYASLTHTRTETDFPDHLLLAAQIVGAGIPGIGIIGSTIAIYAACGGNLGNTYFSSWQQFGLLRNGGWGASGSGGVTGGCSNLVHEQVWHGAGKYAQ